MKQLMILLFALVYGPLLWATQCTLNGSVLFGTNETPVADYKVELAFFEEQLFFTDTTDVNGDFSFNFELEFEGANPIFGIVAVTDFCTGIVLTEPVIFLADFPVAEYLNVVLCSDSNPPPPPFACDAFFQYQQADVDPYIIVFFDLSSTTDEIDSWFWDFGDGASSTLESPSYEYEVPGQYEVSLTIQSDTCESTYTSLVSITDSIACDCNGIFDPVCVVSVEGDTIPFLNNCFAECEGYNENQYFSCIDACEANFEAFPTEIPGQMQFKDLSESVGGEITDWLWEFGEGSTSTEQNPVYSFSEAGMIAVSLRIATSTQCYSTLNQNVLVSSVSSARNISADYNAISVFPNPANEVLYVSLENPERASDYQVSIMSIEGQPIKVLSFNGADVINGLEMQTGDLPPGIYLLQVQQDLDVSVARFIKQ